MFFCSLFFFSFFSLFCLYLCGCGRAGRVFGGSTSNPSSIFFFLFLFFFFFLYKYREEGRINLLIVQLEKVLDYREGQMDEVNTEDEERLVGCLFCPFFVLYCLVFFQHTQMVPIYPKDFIAHLAVFPERS